LIKKYITDHCICFYFPVHREPGLSDETSPGLLSTSTASDETSPGLLSTSTASDETSPGLLSTSTPDLVHCLNNPVTKPIKHIVIPR